MMTGKKHREEEWNKLAALLSGEDVREENSHLMEDNEAKELAKYWNAIGGGHDSGIIDTDRAWERVKPVTANRIILKPERKYSLLMKIAAAVFLVAALGTAVLYMTQLLKGREVIITTSADEISREVILPDGSHAWLNRNTRISYHPVFRGSNRNVNISGEAFFEVFPDKEKPFMVKAGEATIKVTGTSFSVAGRNQAEKVEVYVESGSVVLSLPTGESLILEPGYIGIASGEKLYKSMNENRNYLAWKTGLLVYENTALKDVLPDLEKAFGIEVEAEDPLILDYRITTTFDHDPAETIINVICITFNMTYVKDGNNFRLVPK